MQCEFDTKGSDVRKPDRNVSCELKYWDTDTTYSTVSLAADLLTSSI
jgi:hypothetical protein